MADAVFNGSSSRSSGPGAASPAEEPTHAAQEVVTALVTFPCVAGTAGKGVVAWLLSFRGQRGTVGVYILHLAVADLLFLLCSAAPTVLNASSRAAHVNQLGHQALRGIKHLAYTAGLGLLTAASVQPCLCISFPAWHHSHRRTRLSAVVCAMLWLLSLLLAALVLYFHDEPRDPHPRQGSTVDTIFHVLTLVSFTPIMVLSSVVLFIQVRRSSQPWQWRPTRLYAAILASVFVFLICALAVGISRFILHRLDLPQQMKTLFGNLERLFASVSSSTKPVIYFLAGSQGSQSLREPLGAVLRRALREEPELEGRETPSTGTDQVRVRRRGLPTPLP
ncbi:hypothetical protein HPG69_016686 [Diceros bicornis minor]|uniref:G-protein coupled receptors family 1 profile domain-containing protein n=1 Tax=Diceros bicornis minor TaxID=77932 RepID=A0A7J7EZ10_DICBM|nr:hypothetical protein HPG69_016686 [Diceros bicornis minor]